MSNAPNWQQAFCAPKGTLGIWNAQTGECLAEVHIDSAQEYEARLASFSDQWVIERGLNEHLSVLR
jgi:hypothetical protein